ncbi:hypothetical protein [Ruminococcus sp.]|uniref:hypothetical protein n=1 Tax=Ruminococcus sp. TaxID=41978 RepID=UPI0025805EF5|nr:hypothetical protein [Ruminococcus sp.]
MFSMLSMLQKEGNAAQDTPSLRTQFAPNTAQGSAQVPQGRNSTAGATAQRRGAHKFHKGETARQGRQHSAGGAHKLHKGETARQGRQHSAGGAHKLHEGGRLSEVAALAVVVLKTYNHVVIERCKVCVDLLQLLAHFTCFKPCAYNRYND